MDACANHLGDRRLIETMIQKAAQVGADYIKFQSFEADRLSKNFPDYETNHSYYKSVELTDEDHKFIMDKCKQYNINPLFTVFNADKVDFLVSLGLDIVKIASPDGDNYPLINKCLKSFETVIVSTGMIDVKQVSMLLKIGCKTLYCVSKYPTQLGDIDYTAMQLHDGFSDHSLGIEAGKKAIDLNMGYLEKHFTLGRDLPGRDQAMSTTLDEFKELISYRDHKNKVQIYKTRWSD